MTKMNQDKIRIIKRLIELNKKYQSLIKYY